MERVSACALRVFGPRTEANDTESLPTRGKQSVWLSAAAFCTDVPVQNRAEAQTHFVGASCACSLPRGIAKALPLHCASSPNETRYRLVFVWLRTRKFNGGTNARK